MSIIEIERLRKKLNEAIDNDMDISVILELSRELDKEIAEYQRQSLNDRLKRREKEKEE